MAMPAVFYENGGQQRPATVPDPPPKRLTVSVFEGFQGKETLKHRVPFSEPVFGQRTYRLLGVFEGVAIYE